MPTQLMSYGFFECLKGAKGFKCYRSIVHHYLSVVSKYCHNSLRILTNYKCNVWLGRMITRSFSSGMCVVLGTHGSAVSCADTHVWEKSLQALETFCTSQLSVVQ